MRGGYILAGLALYACQPAAENAPDPAEALQGRWQSDDLDRSIWITDHTIELFYRDDMVEITDLEIVKSCVDPEPSDDLGAYRYESKGAEFCFDVLAITESTLSVLEDRRGVERTYYRITSP